MAFFDFLKGKKNKKIETTEKNDAVKEEEQLQKEEEQVQEEKGEGDSNILEVGGIEISPVMYSDEDISLKVRGDGARAMQKAVSRAMDTPEVTIQISAGGTLYGKDAETDTETNKVDTKAELIHALEDIWQEADAKEELEERKRLEEELQAGVAAATSEEEKQSEEVQRNEGESETEEQLRSEEAVEKVEIRKEEVNEAVTVEAGNEVEEVQSAEEQAESTEAVKEEAEVANIEENETKEEQKAEEQLQSEEQAELAEAVEEAEEANIEENETKEEQEQTTEAVEEESKETQGNETEESQEQSQEKKGFFAKLVAGLSKTRKSILDGVDNVLSAFTKIDEDLFEELEEVLIMADLGVETTMNIIENLRKRVKKEKCTNPQDVKGLLIDEITALLEEGTEEMEDIPSPTVLLVIGVNGVGKTTTIGKLAHNYKAQGKSVLLGAADTFRAAAIDQLEVWGKRAEVDLIKHQENSDPAAVVFDAVNAAKNRKTDILICDTAGRLHNKKNLMDELKKIAKVIEREYPQAHKEVYLVLDATTGQNAMQQAKLFKEVANITGIILTKLDGTAKGGIVIAIKSELKVPVRYIGVGEGINDLQKFDSKSFAKALFGE